MIEYCFWLVVRVRASFALIRNLSLLCAPGVTFVVPLLLDLVHSAKSGKTACCQVHFVWAVKSHGA